MITTTNNNNNSRSTASSNSISATPMSSAPALSSSDKLLQFNRATKTYLVPCIDELTDEVHNALWPTEEDSQRSQQHLAETLQALHLNNGEVPRHLEGQITSRGLENFLASITSDPNSLDHPKTLKDHHTRTVLDCQDQTTCPAIAGASQITSQAAQNRALDLANALERELRIDDEDESGAE